MGHHSALRVVISGKKTKGVGGISGLFEKGSWNIPYQRVSEFTEFFSELGTYMYFFAELPAMTPTKEKKQSIKNK